MTEHEGAERGNGREPREDGGGDAERRAPRSAREQGAPEPERPRSPAEEAGQAPHQLDDPPQAEGKREAGED